jgi:hypothetical protein
MFNSQAKTNISNLNRQFVILIIGSFFWFFIYCNCDFYFIAGIIISGPSNKIIQIIALLLEPFI